MFASIEQWDDLQKFLNEHDKAHDKENSPLPYHRSYVVMDKGIICSDCKNFKRRSEAYSKRRLKKLEDNSKIMKLLVEATSKSITNEIACRSNFQEYNKCNQECDVK